MYDTQGRQCLNVVGCSGSIRAFSCFWNMAELNVIHFNLPDQPCLFAMAFVCLMFSLFLNVVCLETFLDQEINPCYVGTLFLSSPSPTPGLDWYVTPISVCNENLGWSWTCRSYQLDHMWWFLFVFFLRPIYKEATSSQIITHHDSRIGRKNLFIANINSKWKFIHLCFGGEAL